MAGGSGISITGTGSSQDPFVITGTGGNLTAADNTVFNLTLTGTGSAGSPYNLSVAFADTAKLDDLPDVNAAAPTNGQVLMWDDTNSWWEPGDAPTADPGIIQTDNSLEGDGSVGDPLGVIEDPDRFLTTTASGLGLSDTGVNQLVRHYADAAARTADPISPDDNSLSMLDTDPGVVWYWDGAAWQRVGGDTFTLIGTDVFIELSGPYVPGMPITHISKLVQETSDGSGIFEVFSSADLALAAGVITCQFQEFSLPYKVVLAEDSGTVVAEAHKLSDGSLWASQSFQGVADAWLY